MTDSEQFRDSKRKLRVSDRFARATPAPRTRTTISDEAIHNLAVLGLTTEEIRTALRLPDGYMTRERHELIQHARSKLHRSIRYWQIKHAAKGNANLLIWLGKQYLGQSDKIEATVQSNATHLVITPAVAQQLQAQYVNTLRDVQAQRAIPAPRNEGTTLAEGEYLAQVGTTDASQPTALETGATRPVAEEPLRSSVVADPPPGPTPPPREPAPHPRPRLPRILTRF